MGINTLLISSLLFLPCVLSAVSPTITSAGTYLSAKKGETVSFSCIVAGLGNSTVSWYMVDHNTHISSGETVLVDSDRYTIAVPLDGTDASIYNLNINNIKETDQGHYACQVDGTDQKVVHLLRVQDASPPPTASPPSTDLNFTDCCVAQGMTSQCLVMCTPFQVPVNFDVTTTCPLELLNFIKCATDGKNHAACCKRRSVPNLCLDFCLGKVPDNLNDNHLKCLEYFTAYSSCIEEGENYLPGPVTSVSGIAVFNVITVLWKNPKTNSKIVTGFKVHYRRSDEKNFRSTELLSKASVSIEDSDQYIYSINSLKDNRQYYVYITAISTHGSSQPSATIGVQTVPLATAASRNESIYGCCERRLTVDTCKQSLCHTDGLSTLDPSLILGECFNDYNEFLKCFAGERDHTGCCDRYDIPEHCGPFCGSGTLLELSWSVAQCVYFLPIIEGCIEEGSKTIPATPKSVTLKTVGYDSADIEWKPSPLATRYVVSYKQDYPNKQAKKISVAGGTDILLTSLQQLTPYRVQIIAQNVNGSSMPSPPVIFLTSSRPVVTPGTTTPGTPPSLNYNLTGCCMENGLQSKCMVLCDYQNLATANATIVSIFLDPDCLNNLLTLVKCGADGRNHQQCCASKGVSQNCLPLCSYNGNDDELSSSMNDFECAAKTREIAQCFYEGLLMFPLPPQDLTLRTLSSHIAILSWREPSRGPPVDTFTVLYKAVGEAHQMQNSTKRTMVILNNLKPETKYEVKVFSANSNGTSANSDVVAFITLPYDGDKNCTFKKNANMRPKYDKPVPMSSSNTNNRDECQQVCAESSPAFETCIGYTYMESNGDCSLFNTRDGMSLQPKNGIDYYDKTCEGPGSNTSFIEVNWASRIHCCENSGLETDCIAYCKSGTASAPNKCFKDFNKVMACAADGRNHENCCKVNGVPEICLPFCQGKTMVKNSVAALCLTYTSTFITCTGLGISVIPSKPQNVRVTDKSSTYFIISWDAPAENCNQQTPCQYDVRYYEVAVPDVITTISVSTLYFNITALKPSTQYGVRVFARNVNGSSLPTTEYYHTTYRSVFLDMKVSQIPPNIVDKGTRVKLVCDVFGSSSLSFNWTFNGKVVTSRHEYYVFAKETTEGRYTCKAMMNGGQSISRDINLNVRYLPDIVTASGDRVDPNRGLTASLRCEFKGSPTEVIWKKGEETLNANASAYYRYHQWQNVELDKFFIISTLQIYNVIASDFDIYTCTGSNKFGSHDGIVDLKDKSPTPMTTPQPSGPVNASECCKKNGVTSVCLEICDLNVDLSTIFGNSKYQICVLNIAAYMKCATDGKDHTKCCKDKGVSEFCVPFCSATIPDITDPRILECADQTDKLLTCAQESIGKIPSPPQNVEAEQKDGKIIVTWQPPKQYNHLEYYEIFWTVILPGGTTKSQERHVTVNGDRLSYTLKDVIMAKYQFSLRAKNDNGQSQKAMSSVVDVSGVKPAKVQNVNGRIVKLNNIYLTWDFVSGPVDIYTVTYTTGGKTKQETTQDNSLSLMDLMYSSNYSITVFASNKFGRSDPSDSVMLTTANAVSVTAPRTGSKNVVIGVSISIVVLILIVVAAVVVFYMRKQGKSGFGRSEAVAFENPQYGNSSDGSQVQISGLPGEQRTANSGVESFNYQPLHEESEDHPYDNPATLKVDQVGVSFK